MNRRHVSLETPSCLWIISVIYHSAANINTNWSTMALCHHDHGQGESLSVNKIIADPGLFWVSYVKDVQCVLFESLNWTIMQVSSCLRLLTKTELVVKGKKNTSYNSWPRRSWEKSRLQTCYVKNRVAFTRFPFDENFGIHLPGIVCLFSQNFRNSQLNVSVFENSKLSGFSRNFLTRFPFVSVSKFPEFSLEWIAPSVHGSEAMSNGYQFEH